MLVKMMSLKTTGKNGENNDLFKDSWGGGQLVDSYRFVAPALGVYQVDLVDDGNDDDREDDHDNDDGGGHRDHDRVQVSWTLSLAAGGEAGGDKEEDGGELFLVVGATPRLAAQFLFSQQKDFSAALSVISGQFCKFAMFLQ